MVVIFLNLTIKKAKNMLKLQSNFSFRIHEEYMFCCKDGAIDTFEKLCLRSKVLSQRKYQMLKIYALTMLATKQDYIFSLLNLFLLGGDQSDLQHYILAYKIQTVYTEQLKLFDFS